ncbi:MAG TPA: DNA repair protein RadA [Mycobacteriales bacterium]|nr:DNA repair protein RadA [Mycobacteriales bacterium]
MATKTAKAARPAYRCEECGVEVVRWVGRCPECQAWGTVTEVGARPGLSVVAGPVTAAALPIAQVRGQDAQHRPTGEPELDRVLGGGLVPGSVVLVAGEPGVGKSTLLVSAAARIAAGGSTCLLVTGEESAAQVRMRAGRIKALADNLYLAAETDLAAVLGHVDAVSPAVLIVDSVQTIASAGVDGSAGGVAQVREVASSLIKLAKSRGIAVLLVGHVTKDGAIAGPRTLEHLVDVVLSFEGDRHSRLRLVRTVKNRFGPADEVGCFDLRDDGIVGLPDPSGLFLAHGAEPVSGTCVTVTMEGRRALVTEVQALVGEEQPTTPRRATSGLDAQRIAMLLAVLERRLGLKLARREVYAATVGGVRLAEPAADLALALAIAGSLRDQAIGPGVVAIGEVGLAGELRPVSAIRARLAEAARLGFTTALVPRGCGSAHGALNVIEAGDLADAVRRASATPRRPA